MRVVLERLEQQLERARRLALVGEVPGKRQPRSPFARRRRAQLAAQIAESGVETEAGVAGFEPPEATATDATDAGTTSG